MTLGKTDDSTESRAAASQEAIDPPVRLRQPQSGNGRIAVAQRLMDGGSIPPSSTNLAFAGFSLLSKGSVRRVWRNTAA